MEEFGIVTCRDHSTKAEKGLIVAPAASVTQAGLIRRFSGKDQGMGKHLAHTLSQIVLSDYEDDLLDVTWLLESEPIHIRASEETFTLHDGVVMLWSEERGILVWAFDKSQLLKLLREVQRQCTRWIRLDVR